MVRSLPLFVLYKRPMANFGRILTEILDFGYPQNTDPDTLKMYITTEGVKSAIANNPTDSSRITQQATGALSWRRSDIKYRKNEAFVDVIEDVNLLMSATGTVLRADVNGQIVMRAYLTGTPECKFGLNDRLLLDSPDASSANNRKDGISGTSKTTRAAAGSVTLEDCQFHQCVKLGRFDADRIISFVPPDGEFELMRYRATENVNLPFKVHPIVREIGTTKVEYSIAIKANYGSKLFASNVIVRIPTPLNTAKTTERASQGRAKYEPEQNNIVWKIPRFSGQSEYVLNAEATLTSMTHQKAWSRPPINLSFSILMFTSSGLLVRYLKVFEKNNYSSVKWVRYMTRAGSYEIRYDTYTLLTSLPTCRLLTRRPHPDSRSQDREGMSISWACEQLVILLAMTIRRCTALNGVLYILLFTSQVHGKSAYEIKSLFVELIPQKNSQNHTIFRLCTLIPYSTQVSFLLVSLRRHHLFKHRDNEISYEAVFRLGQDGCSVTCRDLGHPPADRLRYVR